MKTATSIIDFSNRSKRGLRIYSLKLKQEKSAGYRNEENENLVYRGYGIGLKFIRFSSIEFRINDPSKRQVETKSGAFETSGYFSTETLLFC